jgi:hypothetical protein
MLRSSRARWLSRIAAVSGWVSLVASLAFATACGDDEGSRPAKHAKRARDAGEVAADGGNGSALCPDGVHDGNLYLETEQDVLALKGCKRITGNLSVSSESLSNLRGLEALATVEGALQIGPTWTGEIVGADTQFDKFKSLDGLENLRSVGALLLNSLGISSLAPLAHLEAAGRVELVHLDGLQDLSGLEKLRWQSMRIAQNSRLRSLSGLRIPERASLLELSDDLLLGSTAELSELRELDKLVLSNLPSLGSLDGLQNIEQITAELSITNCDGLQDLTGLGSIAPLLTISENDELTSLTGRAERGAPSAITVSMNPKLEGLSGLLTAETERLESLMLMALPQLTSLSGLSQLREIGDFTIYHCTALTNVDGLENLHVLSALTMVNAPHVQNLNGLANLERADASLYLNNVPQLTTLQGLAKLEQTKNLLINGLSSLKDLRGLEGIREIDGFEIAANAALESFTGLENLTRANNTILIANNMALSSLDGLSGLSSVQAFYVSANMSLSSLRGLGALATANTLAIQGNRSLPECEVEWLAKRVNAPAPRNQNGPAGTCMP